VAICADLPSAEQVETLLKTQDTTDTSTDATRPDSTSEHVANTINLAFPNAPDVPNVGAARNDAGQHMSWDIMGLGIEEPLPSQEVMDDLYVCAVTGVKVVANVH
jgi:hypothetical protein